jgi:hypothetical protein
MPVHSKAQHGLLGADLARARKGKKTRTGMSKEQLEEYLRGSRTKGLPHRVGHKKTRCRRK